MDFYRILIDFHWEDRAKSRQKSHKNASKISPASPVKLHGIPMYLVRLVIKEILIIDLLGRVLSGPIFNEPIFFIYENGDVKKLIINL